MEAKPGMIARSIAGHDKGNFFVITAADYDFAYLADGKERKLSKPKKKRLKHMRLTNTVIDICGLTDKTLRKTIAEYTAKAAPEKKEK